MFFTFLGFVDPHKCEGDEQVGLVLRSGAAAPSPSIAYLQEKQAGAARSAATWKAQAFMKGDLGRERLKQYKALEICLIHS